MRRSRGLGGDEIMIAPLDHIRPAGRALKDQTGGGLMAGELDRRVQHRLIRHHPAGLEPAGRRNNNFGGGIGDPRRQLRRREATKHHGVHSAQPRAGEHREGRLRDHRHIHHHAVALGHAERGQRAGQLGDPVECLGIGYMLQPPGHRAIPDKRGPIAKSGIHMPVQAIKTGIEPGAREPGAKRAAGAVKNPGWRNVPIDQPRTFRPIGIGGFTPMLV